MRAATDKDSNCGLSPQTLKLLCDIENKRKKTGSLSQPGVCGPIEVREGIAGGTENYLLISLQEPQLVPQ